MPLLWINIHFLKKPENILVNIYVISLPVFFKSPLMHVKFAWLWSMDLPFVRHKSPSLYVAHSLWDFIQTSLCGINTNGSSK